MRPIKRIFFFLLFIGSSYLCSFAQESQYFLHTVERGQNLTSIASMYGINQSEIIKLNPGSDTKVFAGQALKIPQKKNGAQSERFHTIQPGETLYRVSVSYSVSTKAICDANPGLSAENFRSGQVIRIPAGEGEVESQVQAPIQKPEQQPIVNVNGTVQSKFKDMHKVKRKETIYSISREYGLTEQELKKANPELNKEGLKKGTYLRIPYPSTPPVQSERKPMRPTQSDVTYTIPPSNSDLFEEIKEKPKRISTIKTAIILPFTEDKRMVEYYEGFLIAMDSLKRGGVSIDLHVYNSGSDAASIQFIVNKSEMKKMDVIFGPGLPQQITPLAEFAKKNNIRLVIPFTSKDNEVFDNPSIYQVNTPQSYLYSEVYDHFSRQFINPNVIILESASMDKDKEEFIKGLKQDLAQKNISVKTLKETASLEAFKGAMNPSRENIFIPTSDSKNTLTRIIPQLTQLVRENPLVPLRLFGYPKWQTYTSDYIDNFFELDTYFYSSFYTNNLLSGAIGFTNAYNKWYGKEMSVAYPKYGMLGFDTGFFFLKGLSRYGTNLEENVSKMSIPPIQTGFKFQRVNNWGGFVNKKVFFVHFTRSFELIKLDFE